MTKHRITLNRRFRRDIAQLFHQGHRLTYRLTPNRRSLLFQADGGEDMTPNDVMRAAEARRKPLNAEQIAEAEAEAAELASLLKWVGDL